MGATSNGGWFNSFTSTINPFDDKNGAFQGSGPRQPMTPADPGRNLAGYGSGVGTGEPVDTSTLGGAVGAAVSGAGAQAPGTGYWTDYGLQARDQAQQQGQQYQGLLNQSGDASWNAGESANAALATTGQSAADMGTAAQGTLANTGQASELAGTGAQNTLGTLGSQYGSALADTGQQYAGGMTGTGNAAQNYAIGAATAGGRTGNNLNTAGGSLMGQALGAQNRNVSGAQQNALMGLEKTEGPSAAQAQLNQATNANQANALAMARSGRGFGSSASAMRQAAQQRVGAQQQAANQSAVLRAQENAAWRGRQAQNIGASGQLATSQAATNDARQMALNQSGLGAMQAGGNLQLGAGQLGLSGYGQNLAAQQGAANTALTGLGQAAQTEIGANQAGASLALQGLGQQAQAQQAGYGMGLQGLGQQQQAQQAGGALNLQGYGQAGGLYGNAATYGSNNLTQQGNIEQQGLGWEQQHVQNDLTAAGINNGVALQQQNQGNQMMGAYMGAIGSVLPMAAMLSDRNAKEGIEPTNVTLKADEPSIITPVPGTAAMVDTSGNGPTQTDFSQGVGISGPNQAQGASSSQASTAAAGASVGAAGGQPNPGKVDASKYGGVGKGGNLWQTFGGAMKQAGEAAQGDLAVNPVTGQSWYGNSGYNFQPYQAPMSQPMGQMQPITSDEREKEAIKAFDSTPGYSYDYKDPEAMGATNGRQFGIMAQDLEKTPAGRSVVKPGPNGAKMVDTSRLALVEGAAINGLLKRIEKLEGKRSAA